MSGKFKQYTAEQWKEIYEKNIAKITSVSDRYPWHDKEAYGAWLTQTYHLVKHTTRFIALTAARLDFSRNKVHYDMGTHFKEEKGHDLMALKDLENLGYKPGDFPEYPETTAIIRSQYYALDYENPFAHFGYSFCFEGYAVKRAGQIGQVVGKKFGKQTATFLDIHAEVDVAHFAHAFDVLVDVNEEESLQIITNLELSCALYNTLMHKLMERYAGKEKKAA